MARIVGVDALLPGGAAVGTAGDFLLAKQLAAFVITDTVEQSTYWYYGGALADAAPMRGCVPGEDKLDELGIVFAQPDLFAFEQSILRAFEAEDVEVLADGSDGGAAIVRAYGSDSFHWLVEHTLINEAASQGGRPYSEPFGVAITVDYILEPGSPVLQIDINVINIGDAFLSIADAALFQYGSSLSSFNYSSGPIDVAGLNLDAGLPWVMASDGDVSYALGMEGGNLATVRFSGVQVGVDVSALSDGFSLSVGEGKTLTRYLSVGEGKTLTRYLSVGDGDGSTAIEPLLARVPEPLRDQVASAGVIEGRVSGGNDATVLVGARQHLHRRQPALRQLDVDGQHRQEDDRGGLQRRPRGTRRRLYAHLRTGSQRRAGRSGPRRAHGLLQGRAGHRERGRVRRGDRRRRGLGGQVTDTDGEVELTLQIWALAEVDVTHFVVFANCDQVASVLATEPDAVLKYDGTVALPVDGDTHIVIAAFGSNSLPLGLPGYDATRTPRVLTNPIYVDGDGDGAFSAPGGRECSYALGVDQAE